VDDGDGRAGYLRAPAVTPLLTAFDVDEPIFEIRMECVSKTMWLSQEILWLVSQDQLRRLFLRIG